MKSWSVTYNNKRRTIAADTPAEAAQIFANLEIRRKGVWVNGWSLNPDGTGMYQAYVPHNHTGSTSIGSSIRVSAQETRS